MADPTPEQPSQASAQSVESPQSRPAVLLRATDIAERAQTWKHPWNPESEVLGTHLSSAAGLVRTGISRTRIPPGKESFTYHLHHCEEEWLYILSGRGVAEVDGRELELGPGDFLAFPTPSVAHHLRNPFDQPLEYLMGGEAREVEISDFPKLGKRMIRRGRKFEVVPLAAVEEIKF